MQYATIVGYLLLVLFMSSTLNSTAFANSFLKEKKRGWFWREIVAVPAIYDEKEAVVKPQVALNSNELSTFLTPNGLIKAEVLQKILPIVQQQAIDEPTIENVSDYFFLQKMAMDKSQQFALTASKLPLYNPQLDELAKRTQTPNATLVSMQNKTQQQSQQLAVLSQKAGLFFFYRSNCQYCHLAVRQVNMLAEMGFIIIAVSLDQQALPNLNVYRSEVDPHIANVFGITSVPTLVLVAPDSEQRFVILSTSLLQDPQLIDRLLQAGSMLGILPQDQPVMKQDTTDSNTLYVLQKCLPLLTHQQMSTTPVLPTQNYSIDNTAVHTLQMIQGTAIHE